MSDFLTQFEPDPDPDLESIRRNWVTEKPFLRESVVKFAPPYPDFSEIELEEDEEPTANPGCPSARLVDHQMEVAIYNACDNGFGSLQEKAWEFLSTHTGAIETGLRRKLFAWHLKQKARFLEEDLPDFKELQPHWAGMESEIDWDSPSAIDVLFKMVGVSLIADGLDDTGFAAYEFQTGWDQDHGVSIITHQEKVLAAGGLGEFTAGGNMVGGIRAVQSYDLDEGDFSLLDG